VVMATGDEGIFFQGLGHGWPSAVASALFAARP
jgi:hypothetical protein